MDGWDDSHPLAPGQGSLIIIFLMASHPDMDRMRQDTRELRIRDAWGCALDKHLLTPNAQVRLDVKVLSLQTEKKAELTRRPAPRVKTTSEPRHRAPLFKKRHQERAKHRTIPEDNPMSKTLGCVQQPTNKRCVKFVCTSFSGVPTAFSTTSVFLSSQRWSWR